MVDTKLRSSGTCTDKLKVSARWHERLLAVEMWNLVWFGGSAGTTFHGPVFIGDLM